MYLFRPLVNGGKKNRDLSVICLKDEAWHLAVSRKIYGNFDVFDYFLGFLDTRFVSIADIVVFYIYLFRPLVNGGKISTTKCRAPKTKQNALP